MKFIVFICVCVAAANAQFKCPQKDGQYPDPIQCDKFYECNDGIAKTKLCPDGLVFDPEIRKRNKCDHIFNVDCGDREELQPPQPKGVCPRLNGFFAHEDPTVCNKFQNCIQGDNTEMTCTSGLHFDDITGLCVWPETIDRKGCTNQGNTLKDGFKCPKESQKDDNGNLVVHPKYPHNTDCQRFYVCLNGVEPRDLGCQVGEVYNDVSQRCDAPENVPGCEDWYQTEEGPASPKSTKPKSNN